MTSNAVVGFWREAGPDRWFTADPAFDEACRAFLALQDASARGDLADWAETPDGALALILLLDQIPRNVFRGTKRAYATDALACRIAEKAVVAGHDAAFAPALRHFLYLPFEHSENAENQERAVALIASLGEPESLRFALDHRAIIARFGRFPHRNAILGRVSTEAERDYLSSDDAFRG